MILTCASAIKLDQRDILRARRMQVRAQRDGFPSRQVPGAGTSIDIFPHRRIRAALRVSLFDDEIERLQLFDPLTGRHRAEGLRFTILPGLHYVTPSGDHPAGHRGIKESLASASQLVANNKLVEAQRIEQRTRFDIEMLDQWVFAGASRTIRAIFPGAAGEPPPTLIDYLPPDALMFIDESIAMVRSDRPCTTATARAGEPGGLRFRLPSALDNRPLKFEEFEARMRQTVFVSRDAGRLRATHASQVVDNRWSARPAGRPGCGSSGHRHRWTTCCPDRRAHGTRERAGAGHDADQAHGRGTDRLPHRY